jgi:hypothetical protein
MIKLKTLLHEAGLKGAESVPSNKKLAQLSDNDKLKILQSVGNLISFKVPDWSKGRRNFWTVISAGKIVKKKNLAGDIVFFLPGKGPEKVSPSYSSVKELLDGVEWDTMELRRESVNEKKSDDFTDYLSTRKSYSRPTNWEVIKKDGKYSFESDDRSGRVRLMYNGKQIAVGVNDWSTGGYEIEHSSWKNKEKPFQFAKDIIDYFKSNKLTTESVNETKPSIKEGKYYVTYNRGRGQGKGLEKEFDKKAFKTTDKPKVFNSFKDAKEYAEKMEKMFRNSIGGSTSYWVSDEKMNRIEETIKEGVSDIKGFRNKPADTWNDTMIKLVLMRKIEGKTAVYRLETDNWFRRFENPGKGYGLMIRGIKIAAQPTKAPSSFAYGENQSVFKAIIQYLPNEFDNVEDDVKENYETAQGYIILGNKNFTGFEMQQVLSIKDLEGFIKANMGDYKP